MKASTQRIISQMRKVFLLQHILVIALTLLVALMPAFQTFAQDGHYTDSRTYKKDNKRFYKAFFRKQRIQYSHACGLLEKKRTQKPRKPFFASRHKAKPMAEIDPSVITASVKSVPVLPPRQNVKPVAAEKPIPKASPVKPKIEHISDKQLEELHKKEDDVLAKNDLPVPTSQKQAEVRKIVSDKLASKTNIYPLILAPLYFNFDEDEFSVVDMEPFLIAAEYALQGRTVLIEGHTDNRGADNYNVQLSIKRVQKIRQLMLDMGVPDDRISVVGYGEELKTNDNKTTEGRLKNRRVDFTIF